MKIAICQLNPTVGDIEGNTEKLIGAVNLFKNYDVDLFIFSELFILGYPPRDLLAHDWFINNSMKALEKIKKFSIKIQNAGILFGSCMPNNKKGEKKLTNSAILIHKGKIIFQQNKSLLPSYDVFDETRHFSSQFNQNIILFKKEKLGISICEDAWNIKPFNQNFSYDYNPIDKLAQKGATILINISASPYYMGKEKIRYSIIKNHAKKHKLPFLLVNQVGANDELIFDGNSMAVDSKGNLRELLPSFKECCKIVDTNKFGNIIAPFNLDSVACVHDALICGIHDYLTKCGFSKALIGLSGGIDSAVTCVLAVKALGAQNVWGITMPSRYSSQGSINDSKELAQNLGVKFSIIPIDNIFSCFLSELSDIFSNTQLDITEENIQARIRGSILMALSNKFNYMVLSTGNKSELAVGYCTLYGDMNGGLSVISDVPKTMIYKIANYINKEHTIIPQSIINKPPSAELKPNQKDQDTLPPYEILDPIIELFVEQGLSSSQIIKKGFNKDTVEWVISAIKKSEYKRKQAAPALKVTPKAFGSGRRFPIAAKYKC
jgi:NAD+ synthase (glutamine-hydrolysing)